MPVEILMPELGESVHEGTVSRWLKQEGDPVKEDEPVVEIMTDKVNTELPAPASGVLHKILIPEGGQVEVFKAMGLILEAGEVAGEAPRENGKPPAPAATPVAAAPVAAPSPSSASAGASTEKRWYSPVVRAMAREHGISEAQLASIPGTGERGRVNKRDMEAFLAGSGAAPAAPQVTISTPSAPAARLEPIAPTAPVTAGPEQEIVPLAGMRKMIADAMMRASQIPAVSTLTEVDVTAMVKFRDRNKESFPEQFGIRLTYTPFFIKAISEALLEFPLVNASLQGDQIVMNRAVHMGVAVSLGEKGDQGLIVPVIRDTHKKGLIEVGKELEALAARARSNSLGLADVQGGTFTLTNPGSYGATLGTPMINAPQAAILGTYTFKKVPVIVDDMIAVRSIMNLVLTYDHRLIDGLLAGKFLQSVKAKLEKFEFFK